ncbi:MAG TPA: hypothetical protein PLN33_15660 [Hyphomonadaceae bacterium]|nr:hypothetical protein [Hyphomonadaceae bacterium]
MSHYAPSTYFFGAQPIKMVRPPLHHLSSLTEILCRVVICPRVVSLVMRELPLNPVLVERPLSFASI